MSMPYDWYIERMAKTGSWGDHLTLDSIANVFDVRVWCIESSPNIECCLVAPEQDRDTTANVYIGHVGQHHFISVTPSTVCCPATNIHIVLT